jgi:hypothetical protein
VQEVLVCPGTDKRPVNLLDFQIFFFYKFTPKKLPYLKKQGLEHE